MEYIVLGIDEKDGRAMVSGALAHIPARKTRRVQKNDAPTKFFTLGEINALLNEAAASRRRPELAIALVEISYNHGLRNSEAGLLQWEGVSFEDDTISITRLKGGAADVIHPMVENDREVLLALKAMYERQGVAITREVFKTEKRKSYIKVKPKRWVTKDGFVHEGETYTAPGLSDLIKRLVKRCEGFIRQDLSSHGLRHSCATYLAKAGKTEHQIQQWLGHTSGKNTKRYMGQILPDIGSALSRTS